MRRAVGPAFVVSALATALLGVANAAGPARFDGSLAFRHIERLVAIGPRPAGSPGAERARQYLVGELKRSSIETRVQPFDADTPHGRLRMANVVAVLPGRRPDVILIGGHYDTKWFREIRFVGANDGGSSTALLLELARVLAGRSREFTYWIAFLDGEEARETWSATDSLYGSRHLAVELARTKRLPRLVLIADMIGDRDLVISPERYSTAWVTDLVWSAARRLRYEAHFGSELIAVEDDHVPFLQAGVPAALLIDFDYPPWHTAADTIDNVSADSLTIVGEVLLDALPTIEERLARGGAR